MDDEAVQQSLQHFRDVTAPLILSQYNDVLRSIRSAVALAVQGRLEGRHLSGARVPEFNASNDRAECRTRAEPADLASDPGTSAGRPSCRARSRWSIDCAGDVAEAAAGAWLALVPDLQGRLRVTSSATQATRTVCTSLIGVSRRDSRRGRTTTGADTWRILGSCISTKR